LPAALLLVDSVCWLAGKLVPQPAAYSIYGWGGYCWQRDKSALRAKRERIVCPLPPIRVSSPVWGGGVGGELLLLQRRRQLSSIIPDCCSLYSRALHTHSPIAILPISSPERVFSDSLVVGRVVCYSLLLYSYFYLACFYREIDMRLHS